MSAFYWAIIAWALTQGLGSKRGTAALTALHTAITALDTPNPVTGFTATP